MKKSNIMKKNRIRIISDSLKFIKKIDIREALQNMENLLKLDNRFDSPKKLKKIDIILQKKLLKIKNLKSVKEKLKFIKNSKTKIKEDKNGLNKEWSEVFKKKKKILKLKKNK